VIEIHFIDVEEVPGLEPELLFLWLSDSIKNEGFECGDINLILCSDEHLLEVNQTFLNHDYYTDIVTFDYSFGSLLSGDLFISLDRVLDNSTQYNESFLTELRRVCVHGILHLCGFKDKTTDEEKLMRSKEEFYLNKYVSRET
jgi:probable rRNA maturation factor